MMSEAMMKQMPHMMTKPVATGAMLAATGFAAGRGLLGRAILHNPLTLLAVGAAGGVAAGFLLFKYQKEIVEGLSKITGMGKDFALHQKENLNDLMAEAEEKLSGAATPPAAQGVEKRAEKGMEKAVEKPVEKAAGSTAGQPLANAPAGPAAPGQTPAA